MKTYLIIFSLIYLLFMLFYAYKFSQKKLLPESFLFANSSIGITLTFLGILATLFSTFTLQGIPSFFANHGMGTWIFLGITDVALAGLLLYFGLKLRKLSASFSTSPKNITELLKIANYPKFIIFFHIFFTSIFLIPYITIQIKGAAFLFNSAFPVGEGYLFWSCIIVSLMLLYSAFGGIRAIYITDAFQGVVIFITSWIIAYFILKNIGGMESLFSHVREANEALLSLPGPKGLLSWQFLLVSFISIVLMPYAQPQLTTRILVAKDDKSFVKATLVFAFFVILVILPTMIIGFRGALVEEGNFLLYILNHEVPDVFYALFIIGVISASMSTSDSILMAIGTEWGSFFSKSQIKENKNANIYVKSVALIVALISLALAQTSFKSLVLFSINSFIGTSFLVPILYSISLKSNFARRFLIFMSIFCIGIFTLKLLSFIPSVLFGFKIELFLYAFMGIGILYIQGFCEKIALINKAS